MYQQIWILHVNTCDKTVLKQIGLRARHIFIFVHILTNFSDKVCYLTQNFDIDGFTYYELHRTEKKVSCTRNSGGIIVYVRNELVCDDILFLKCNDSHLWLKINKTCLGFVNDIYICLCYIPPSNSSRQGIIESSIYDDILENIFFVY